MRRATGLVILAVLLIAPGSAVGADAPRAPEFPHQDPARWVGAPVRLQDLRGKVVLLDVWTFG